MMDTTWTVIKIFRIAPEQLQRSRTAPEQPLQSGYYLATVPTPSKSSRQNTIHPQHQSLCMNSIPEKQGASHYS